MEKGVLFCFGLGFSAQRLSKLLQPYGWKIRGTCRTPEKVTEMKRIGIDAHVFDGTGELDSCWIDGATHLLSSVPPNEAGDPVLTNCREILVACGSIKWIGYLSTTGVYGNTDGEWVDETSATRTEMPRSQRRIKSEKEWLSLDADNNLSVNVFRLAGIYGPGRNALNAIRAGRARRIDKPGHKFSRIHVDDIALVLHASMEKPNSGAIYNVCDDFPAPPAEVTAFGCSLLGVEPPPLVPYGEASKNMTPMGLSFWKDNRRVRNDRIKRELGVSLAYPTYREGLRALAADLR